LEECGPCPVFAGFTLEFALQMRKKHGKNFNQGSTKLYFTPNIIRIVEKKKMDMASNMDVLEEKCIKSFCREYHFGNLGIHERTKLKFIFQIR
jgi:hypothetical protein